MDKNKVDSITDSNKQTNVDDQINAHKPATSNETEDQANLQDEFNPMGFSPDELQKEFQDLIEKKFGGRVQVMTMMDGVPLETGDNKQSQANGDDDENKIHINGINDFNFKPKDIKKYLDRFVIGQDEAKKALAIAVCDHYNHLKNEISDEPQEALKNYQKQNVLLLGPTGVGKTYLVKLISDLINVPFVKADATRFSEVGYMGANVDDIIRDLVQKAGGDVKRAMSGIVYVDEVDKLASKKDSSGRDVSGRGVQFGFLRLLENTDVDLNASHDIASQFKTLMSFQKKGKADKEIVNTKNILFIFSGAFHGLETIINQRLQNKSIGLHVDKNKLEFSQTLKKLETKDLIDFGFEHEFIGRLPVRVACENLSEDDLYQILTGSEHSIVFQYVQSFKNYGIDLRFTKEALRLLSKQAHGQKTGARALSAVFEECLRPFKFELPSTGINKLEVSEELIKNPYGVLYHLLESQKK